jgi:hypothetical protein
MTVSSLSLPRLSKRALSMPGIDPRIWIMIIVLVVVCSIALIGLVIYITIRLKKRWPHEVFGPYEGTLVHPEDLAAQITPYGGSGPHRGRNIPRFSEFILYCGIYFRVLMTSYSTYSRGGHANCFS